MIRTREEKAKELAGQLYTSVSNSMIANGWQSLEALMDIIRSMSLPEELEEYSLLQNICLANMLFGRNLTIDLFDLNFGAIQELNGHILVNFNESSLTKRLSSTRYQQNVALDELRISLNRNVEKDAKALGLFGSYDGRFTSASDRRRNLTKILESEFRDTQWELNTKLGTSVPRFSYKLSNGMMIVCDFHDDQLLHGCGSRKSLVGAAAFSIKMMKGDVLISSLSDLHIQNTTFLNLSILTRLESKELFNATLAFRMRLIKCLVDKISSKTMLALFEK